MPGSEKIGQDISGLNQQVSDAIAAKSQGPGTIDPMQRLSYLPEVRATLAKDTTAGPAGMKAVDAVEANYRANPMNQLGLETPADAQASKVAGYRNLKNEYASLGTPEGQASADARMALLRGMKDDVVKAVPEVGPLNAQESKLIPLERILDRAGWRGANRDPISIGMLAAPNVPKTLLGIANRPAATAGLGIGLDRLGQATGGNVPPSIRAAVMQALRDKIAQLMPGQEK
jgi:hypothetical protein